MLRLPEVQRHLPTGERYCSILKGKHNSLHFYLHRKAGAKSLLVLFPGAYDLSKGTRQFQRYSWSSSLPGHVLIFDDPTINHSNNLSIGWFQGKRGKNLYIFLRKAIEAFVKSLSIEISRVIFFGSSAGGFVSLKMAQDFPEAYAVVINPQTNILSYARSHVSKLLSYSFGVEEESALSAAERRRLGTALRSNRMGKVFYFQNTDDTYHMKRHLEPFRKSLMSQDSIMEGYLDQLPERNFKTINVIYYSDPERGHSPPSKDMTLSFINIAHHEMIESTADILEEKHGK